MMKKPRLSLGNDAEKDSVTKKPRLGIKKDDSNNVTGTRSNASVAVAGVGQLVKTILFMIGFAVILLGVLYSALSATLMFTAPHNDSATDRVWVARGAFPGGVVPEGSYIYGSSSEAASSSILTKTMEGYTGTTDYFVAKNLAGPFGKVTTDAQGVILVDGKTTSHKGTISDRLLNKSYLAICQEGDCKKGDLIIVPQENIVGEAKGFVSLNKFTFNTYQDGLESEQQDVK